MGKGVCNESKKCECEEGYYGKDCSLNKLREDTNDNGSDGKN